ncbi:MAG: FtsX-like permease family protein [Bacilli bacterium]|nr:FtsX-like permease family protein [Bacilli bacterium]
MRLVKALLFPYLKRFWLMLLSIGVIGAFGTGVLIGLRNAYTDLDKAIDEYVSTYHFPDLTVGVTDTSTDLIEFYYAEIPDAIEEKERLEQIRNDIEHITFRYVYSTVFKDKKEEYNQGKIYTLEKDEYLSQYVYEKKEDTSVGVRMEYRYAKNFDFRLGDMVEFPMPNGNKVSFPIVAIVSSPETSVVQPDAYALPTATDYCYLYMDRALFDKHCVDPQFNEVYLTFKEGKSHTLKEIGDLMSDLGITSDNYIRYAYEKDDSAQIKRYNDFCRALNAITIGAPAFFFLVALAVTALFIGQIIRQCRKDIGVMRALGEKTKDIALVYIALTVVTNFLSWLVGFGIGVGILALANNVYGTTVGLPTVPFSLDPILVLSSFLAMMLLGIVTSWLCTLGIAKVKPVEAMKALPPANNKTPLLTKTLLKSAPIALKVNVSQIIRNLRRFIMSTLCLTASGIMVLASISLLESRNNVIKQTFDTRLDYSVQCYFSLVPDNMDTFIADTFYENGVLDPNVEKVELMKYYPVTIKYGDKDQIVLLNGVKEDSELLRVVSSSFDTLKIPATGIVLSKSHADGIGAKVGDTILVNEKETKVAAISEEWMYQVSYMSYTDFDTVLGGHDYQMSVLAKVKNNTAFNTKYSSLDNLTYIAFISSLRKEYDKQMLAIDISASVLIAIAMINGFMIVFNMMQTNLREQKRTLATMRTLGFQRSSLSNANLSASLVQYVLAMVIALPLGVTLSTVLLGRMSTSARVFPFVYTWTLFALTLALVLLFLLISHFFAMREMKKWILSECVKERE